MRRFFMLAVAMPLATCMVDPTTPARADTCGAAALQNLVGQPESVLATLKFANTVRIIHPTDPVTMDMQSNRLNIDVSLDGLITGVRCG